MSCALKLQITIIIISYVYSQQMGSIDPNVYGPYKVKWGYYELCNGPKKENFTNIRKSLLVENDVYKGVINISFAANTPIDELKITVIANKERNAKKLLWNYKVDKPCQHFAIAWVINTHLGASTNCVVKKGDYYIIVDFTEATYKFLGTSFFYGDFIFKVLVLSKKGNIACILFNPIFTKK